MSARHTPGPWQLQDERFPIQGHTVLGPNTDEDAEPGDLLAVATGISGPDARLVAAAPELADAVDFATGLLEAALINPDCLDVRTMRQVIEQARAALKKAGRLP